MAEFVGSWVRLTDVPAVTVAVTVTVSTRSVPALACMGATPASAVMAEIAKAKAMMKALSRYIAELFLSGIS